MANGLPAFAQYRPNTDGPGYHGWALQVLEFSGGKISFCNSFLDTEALFPLFGLPLTDGRLKKIIGFTVVPRAPVMPEFGAHLVEGGQRGWARACGRR